MGIFDALNTAVTGLSAQSFALQNISGNIANSQTTAFKGTSTEFENLLSQQAAPGHEAVPLIQGETVLARFFVFDRQPIMDRLVAPNPETPLPAGPVLKTANEAVDRVYWYALGRAPTTVGITTAK